MIRRHVQRIRPHLAAISSSMRHATDAKTVRKPHPFEQFAYAGNLEFVEGLAEKYAMNPNLVDPSWWPILKNVTSASPDAALLDTFARPLDNAPGALDEKDRVDNMKVAWMIRAFEFRGHHLCRLDPLGMYEADLDTSVNLGLEPTAFGFTEADMDRVFNVNIGASFGALVTCGGTPMKLRDIYKLLQDVYASHIGFEYMNTGFFELRNWFRQQIVGSLSGPANDLQLWTLNEVVKACGFEKFLALKYATQKRFGLDGAESLIPAMNVILDECAEMGMERCIIGMPHRGRLNVLTNVCGKSLEKIFNEFEGRTPKEEVMGTGDVKYHMGIERERETRHGRKISVNLMANPSHLECINPLVVGATRRRQLESGDDNLTRNVPMLLHGDAAFAGQGVCYETMGLCDLENFHVGGTIHIVVNNQVGFTTDPIQSRSSQYCTDLSRVNNAPVIHVNADNVDQVVRAALIAARFRQTYKRDIIIDLVCYRRNGHNETDVPAFTQPVMYKKIKTHPVVSDIYGKQLVGEGVLAADELKGKVASYDLAVREAHTTALKDDAYVKVKDVVKDGVPDPRLKDAETTGVPLDVLREIGRRVTVVPDAFKMHPKAEGPMKVRREAMATGEGVEWCLAEALAFGSMAEEGTHVRLTGQDVERGTFSQRHAVLVDFNNNRKYMPLGNISPSQAVVTISNSSLSEFGVCGFETGYAVNSKKSFVMWEAQFGDFANGAQVIFDQFLCSGEAKWFKQNPLTISLPHGYDGQGPEHSSSRIERFLQAVDDSHEVPADFNLAATGQELTDLSENRIREVNWQVCYPSKPSNYFHLLRRQVHRSFRKPLIFAFAKSGLRAPNVSTLAEMGPGTLFTQVLEQPCTAGVDPSTVTRVIFCTGQIERKLRAMLEAARKEKGAEFGSGVVFANLEQIAPFPWEHVGQVVQKYHAATNGNVDFCWLQEEPKNMGAWQYIRPRLNNLVQHLTHDKNFRVPYVGRPHAASPATGYEAVHAAEEKAIFNGAFSVTA